MATADASAHIELHAPDVAGVRTCTVTSSVSNAGRVLAGETLDVTIPAGVVAGDILCLGVAYINRTDISPASAGGYLIPGPRIETDGVSDETFSGNLVLGDAQMVFVNVEMHVGASPSGNYDDGYNASMFIRNANGTEGGETIGVGFSRPAKFGTPDTLPEIAGAANAAIVLCVLRGATWADAGFTTGNSDSYGPNAFAGDIDVTIGADPGISLSFTSWQGTASGPPTAPGRTLAAGGDVTNGASTFDLGYAMFYIDHPGGALAAAAIPEAIEDNDLYWGYVAPYFDCIADEVCALVFGGVPGRVNTAVVLGADPAGRAVFPEEQWFTWPQPEPTPTPEAPIPPWVVPNEGPYREDQGQYD